LREALRNRGGAQNVAASVTQAAASEPETGFSGRKDPPMPAQGSAGLDWLDLRAFAPKNLQNVIEKLRIDLQPAVIQKGFISEAEEVTRLHSHYKDGCGEDSEVTSASAPVPTRKGAKGAGRSAPKAKGKAKATGLKAALQARGGMQQPVTEPLQISAFEHGGNNAEAGGMSPRVSSPLASSPLPSVEEDFEAEAADHSAPKEEPDYLVGPVPVVEEAVEEAAAAAEQATATRGASSGAAPEEEEPVLQEVANADSRDAQNAEDASGDAAAADGTDETQARSAEESHEGDGDEPQDSAAKAEEPAQSDKVKKEFTKVVTTTRAEKVTSYDFRVQHFNQPVAKSSDGPIPWKASAKRGDLRRAATTPVGEMQKEDLDDKEKTEESGDGTETDSVTTYGSRFRENKEVPKKLTDLQDFWGKKSMGFAGPSLGGNKRISKGEAQATLQRLIAAGGAVDFDEVRRLRKLIAELE